MSNRRITHVLKDEQHKIVSVSNPGEVWSPRSVDDVIQDIETQSYRYYVMIGFNNVDVRIEEDYSEGKYLCTDPGITTSNFLEFLPEGTSR